MSKFLNESPFNGGISIQGTFSFSSSVPVGVIAIRRFTNERGEFLITTLPVTNITLMNSSVALLPHFADGKGWTTEVILTNPSDSPLTGTVEFFNPGSPTQIATAVNISLNGETRSIFSYGIPPRAAVRLATG